MKKLRSRLQDLMWEKHITSEALAEATGIDVKRVYEYRDGALRAVDLRELEAIMDALALTGLDELYELRADDPDDLRLDDSVDGDNEWHAPCPANPGHRHDWYKDMEVSNSVYQEFECRVCGKRIHLIW